MKAVPVLDERHVIGLDRFVELRIWRVPTSVRGSKHQLKYALALIVEGVCVLRYDNEAGKGDHKHIGETEIDYRFTTAAQLLADFWNDVETWRPR